MSIISALNFVSRVAMSHQKKNNKNDTSVPTERLEPRAAQPVMRYGSGVLTSAYRNMHYMRSIE